MKEKIIRVKNLENLLAVKDLKEILSVDYSFNKETNKLECNSKKYNLQNRRDLWKIIDLKEYEKFANRDPDFGYKDSTLINQIYNKNKELVAIEVDVGWTNSLDFFPRTQHYGYYKYWLYADHKGIKIL